MIMIAITVLDASTESRARLWDIDDLCRFQLMRCAMRIGMRIRLCPSVVSLHYHFPGLSCSLSLCPMFLVGNGYRMHPVPRRCYGLVTRLYVLVDLDCLRLASFGLRLERSVTISQVEIKTENLQMTSSSFLQESKSA